MSSVQGGFAGMNTVRNISLIQRSISKTSHRVPPAQDEIDENSALVETPEPPNEMAISQQMRSQIGSLTDSLRSLEFKMGRNEAAVGAIGGLIEKAKEMREVAVEAAGEVVVNAERGKAFQASFDAVVSEYNDMLAQASFSGKKLLDGSSDAAANLRPVAQLDVSSAESAKDAVKDVDRELRSLKEALVSSEAKTQSEYEATVRKFEVASQNLSAAGSQVRDRESAAEQAQFMKLVVQEHSDLAAAAQGQMSSDTVFKLLHA